MDEWMDMDRYRWIMDKVIDDKHIDDLISEEN